MKEKLKKPFILAIAGGSASGKSSIAKALEKTFAIDSVDCIPLDSYYWPQSDKTLKERELTNYDHPDAFDWNSLENDLRSLINGKEITVPKFDYENHTSSDQLLTIKPRSLIILEGVLVLWPKSLVDLYDYKIFVDCPTELRLERRLKRDLIKRGRTRESVIWQWNTSVEPMFKKFCEPTKACVDLVLDAQGSITENSDKVFALVNSLL